MTEIHVSTSRSYTVSIGSGLLDNLQLTIAQLVKGNKVCIVSDSNIFPIYGENVCANLMAAGFEVCSFVFPAGENSKNIDVYGKLLNFLAENSLSRTDCITALGGGVVGDLAGFAAATYLRGIPYIQVPTSLLAMVDSSVGGKTAIDLPTGKNLCGAFYQPAAVVCDLDTLNTLPEDIFRDGCAEIIKYAVLFDPDLFVHLEQAGADFDRETVISRCIQLKRHIVEQDEFDAGMRKLLNLGHTLGHAIEKCSDYTLSHGKAVSIGMAMAARAIKCPDAGRVASLLQRFQLPISTSFCAVDLAKVAAADKKRSADSIELIVPETIGNCKIVPTPFETLKTFIEEGM